MRFVLLIVLLLNSSPLCGKVTVGADRIFTSTYLPIITGKRVGLVTNHTGITGSCESTLALFERYNKKGTIQLVAVFAPEHGLSGEEQAGEKIHSSKTESGIPVFSLYGETRRPTKQMLENLDCLVYDIQDIGTRSYTYASTLFCVMEEAAKQGITVIVLDRPNPLGGTVVDGTMVEEGLRSFVSYINVPYCHGMTIGELASFFNAEYKVRCNLIVIPMMGWKRGMTFVQTELPWIPTSPNIPEPTTPFFYPATGLLGELYIISVGGDTLPFKLVAAPFFNGKALAKKLNANSPKGVHFQPMRVKPSSGAFNGKLCDGVLIIITDWNLYNPIEVQYLLFDALKQLYPEIINQALQKMANRLPLFHKLCGCRTLSEILLKESSPYKKLRALHAKERADFMKIRQKYLNPLYNPN